MGGLGITYIRALSAMPASIRIGASRSRGAANAYDVTFGSGALMLATAIGLSVAFLLRNWLDADALPGGAFVGLWSLRSYIRTAVFARGNPMPAAVGDAVFGLVGTVLTAVLLWANVGDRLQGAFGLLGLANGMGIVATLIASRRSVRVSLRRSVRRRYAELWRQLGWSGISVTTTNLQGQGMALVVAVMAGPAAYAPIAAILVLFVPLRIVATALANMMQPELAFHTAQGEKETVWHQAQLWTLVMASGSILYGVAMLFVLPSLNIRVLQGTSIFVVDAFAWAICTTSTLYVMPRIILEVLGLLRAIALISAISAVVGMAMVVAILLVASPALSLAGSLVSEIMVLIGSWLVMTRKFCRGPD
jgi:O-antigen/teichoic acid export membrane protein